jgi:hypothetical protein
MVSYYDHQRDVVPRPTIVHDWGQWNLKPGQAADAHRNPTLSIDGDGYVWVFVSGHGDTGYVYRSKEPCSVESFEQVIATPMTYPNPWWIPNKGFFVFFTRYDRNRESFWTTCPDGKGLADPATWKVSGQLSAWTVGQEGDKPGHGIYQYTAAHGSRVATVMNNWIGQTRDRSNLFYLQSDDMGKTWQTADGKDFTLPIREVHCAAMVRDFWGEHLQVGDPLLTQLSMSMAFPLSRNYKSPIQIFERQPPICGSQQDACDEATLDGGHAREKAIQVHDMRIVHQRPQELP